MLTLLLGCAGPTTYDREDPVAYIEDAAYRRRVLEEDLVSTGNQYALVRLAGVSGGWEDLEVRDPPSVAVSGALPEDFSAATSVAPVDLPATEAEWIALGRRTFFEYPLSRDAALLELMEIPDGLRTVGFLEEDGAFVGIRAFEVDGEVAVGTTCARCHVGRDADGVLTGQLANREMDIGLARWLAIDATGPGSEIDSTVEAQLLALGPGRTDVLSDGVFNPYAYPDLGGLVDVPYLHHTSNWVHRGTATLALRCESLFITSNRGQTRIPRVLSWAVAKWIRSLEPAAPTDPDHPLRAFGEVVFSEAACVGCHVPPLYTSDRMVALDEVGTDAAAGESRARSTGLYRIPSLRGVSQTAPYLHHGAFESLEAMFDPERSEPGHPWGLELSASERAALLGFLRSI